MRHHDATRHAPQGQNSDLNKVKARNPNEWSDELTPSKMLNHFAQVISRVEKGLGERETISCIKAEKVNKRPGPCCRAAVLQV